MLRSETILPPATAARLETCFRDAVVEHARRCKTLAPARSLVDAGVRFVRGLAAEASTCHPRGNPYFRLVNELPALLDMTGVADHDGHGAHLLRAMRPIVVTVFAYGVPTEPALDTILAHAEGRPIVEIGAGGGYWARCLSDRGAAITAFDRVLPMDQLRPGGRLFQHHPVAIGTPADALAALSRAGLLLLCWPPGLINRDEAKAGAAPIYSTMGNDALDGFAGSRLVVVGDGGQSFGSPAFYARLEQQWRLTARLPLPNLGSWRDDARFYQRR